MLSGLGHPEQQAAVAHSKKCPSLGYGTTNFIALTFELGAGSNDECHLFWKIPGKKGGDGAALVAQMTNDLGKTLRNGEYSLGTDKQGIFFF